MKTITLQGTEEQFKNLTALQESTDNSLPILVETRVYAIDMLNVPKLDWESLTDEEFIKLAEEQGNIYSLARFTEAFNEEDINPEIDVIRFISVSI